jgi:hypothetical protein
MIVMEDTPFAELDARALEAHALATAFHLGLPIPEAYVQGVLENLGALQTHAAILAAALS